MLNWFVLPLDRNGWGDTINPFSIWLVFKCMLSFYLYQF